MSGILPHTVRGRFIFLIVLAFIPSLALFWYANRELTSLSEQTVEQELLRLAEGTGADFEHMVEEARAMLFALAMPDQASSSVAMGISNAKPNAKNIFSTKSR